MEAKDKQSAGHEKDIESAKAKPSLWMRMKERTTKALAIAGVALAVAGPACGFDAQGLKPIEEDAGTSATHDGGHDSGTKDAGHDAGAGADAGHDSGVGGDAGHDSGMGGDAGYDSGVGGDAGADAGPAVCPSATTGNYSGQVTNTAPKVIGGFGFLYKGKFGTDAIVDITCDANGAPIISGLICPQGVATSFDVSQDGKKITITNTYAGINAMNGVFVVTNL